MEVTNPEPELLALDFEDAVSVYIDHFKTQHRVSPINPELEFSKRIGNTWHLSNERGLLGRVDAMGAVS